MTLYVCEAGASVFVYWSGWRVRFGLRDLGFDWMSGAEQQRQHSEGGRVRRSK